MHYAVPRILFQLGCLERLCTDICSVKGWPRLLGLVPNSLRPNRLARLLDRVPKGLPPGKITAFTSFGWEYFKRRSAANTESETTATHLWAGRRFGELVLARGFGDAGFVYTYNSAGLEILEAAKSEGLQAVMEQTIAPREVEEQLISREMDTFPGWGAPCQHDPYVPDFCERERAERDVADVIICGSHFVKEMIEDCGGPAERCIVVPYGVDVIMPCKARTVQNGKLKVLTVGAIGLRKGSPYVLQAAKALAGHAEFRMVGPLNVATKIKKELSEYIEVKGAVPRSEMHDHYAWADVFLLPSLCEGSATATYEALASGCPVICTPNTGSVIRDGAEGFIVPARDSQAIAERIERFIRNRPMLYDMGRAAIELSGTFTLSAYANRLAEALSLRGRR